jgi:hypothetical protein
MMNFEGTVATLVRDTVDVVVLVNIPTIAAAAAMVHERKLVATKVGSEPCFHLGSGDIKAIRHISTIAATMVRESTISITVPVVTLRLLLQHGTFSNGVLLLFAIPLLFLNCQDETIDAGDSYSGLGAPFGAVSCDGGDSFDFCVGFKIHGISTTITLKQVETATN